MEIRTINRYRDKDTKKVYSVGDTRTVIDKRGKDLIKKGYAEEIPVVPSATTTSGPVTDDASSY